MKKQRKQLICLLVLAVLCVGAWVLVRNADFKEETEEKETVWVTDFDEEQAVELSVTGEYPLHFIKEEGEWLNAEDRSVDLDQSEVESLLARLGSITTDTFFENEQDSNSYGLEEAGMTVTVTMQDGSHLAMRIGDKNEITGQYYLQVDGTDTIYLAASSLVSGLQITPEDFAAEEETVSETETVSESE